MICIGRRCRRSPEVWKSSSSPKGSSPYQRPVLCVAMQCDISIDASMGREELLQLLSSAPYCTLWNLWNLLEVEKSNPIRLAMVLQRYEVDRQLTVDVTSKNTQGPTSPMSDKSDKSDKCLKVKRPQPHQCRLTIWTARIRSMFRISIYYVLLY